MDNKDNQREPATLLWTGGWDSSFRLLQTLLVEHRPVITHYVIDLERTSTVNELNAMADIRQHIEKRLDDPTLFPPTMIVLRSDLPVYQDIKAVHESIKTSLPIGDQYEWLACYARFKDVSALEMCMPWHIPQTPLHEYIFEGLDSKTREGATLRRSADVQTLFGRFTFPTLTLTKADMGEAAREHNFLEILHRSWFCHKPVRGKPCGICKPCQISVEQGRNIQYARLARFRNMSSRGLRTLRTLPRRIASRLRKLK